MPTTVNGIGTHYYGKANWECRTGTCKACGARARLESYDTRLWVVIVFIPIIPLGRKRIIDQCSHCQRHWVTDLTSFEMSKQLDISGAMDKYRAQPTPETALELHGRLLSFQQFDQAHQLRELILSQFQESAVLHAGLASHLDQIGRQDDAVALYEKAYSLRPDLPEARVGLAYRDMDQGQLDKARELLNFLELPGAAQLYSLAPLDSLAVLYQRAGRHAEAIALWKHIIAELPAVGQDANLRKFVAVSEKASQGSDSILPKKELSAKRFFGGVGSQAAQWRRRLTGIAIVCTLIAVCLSGISAYIRHNRTVYAIYEGPAALQVAIDGKEPVAVGPRTKLVMAEGAHHVKVSGAVDDEFDIELSAGFFERLFKSPVWVLNCDGSTALVCETVHYATNPRPSESRILIGERLFYLPHVDYAFTPPPQQLKVDSRTSEITKTCLETLNAPPAHVFHYALKNCAASAAFGYCEGCLKRNREDGTLLGEYTMAAEEAGQTQRAEQFLKAGLAHRPVSVPWHRAYQDLNMMQNRQAETAASYDALLQQSPDDARLLYLRGRVEDDKSKAQSYYDRARAADPQLSWPYMALAYQAAASGDWPKSRTLAEKAFELKLGDPNLLRIRHEARLATGDLAKMDKEYAERVLSGAPEEQMSAALNLCDVLAAKGRADQEGDDVLKGVEARMPPELQRSDAAFNWRQMALYRLGKLDQADQAARAEPNRISPELRMHILIAAGRPQEVLDDASMHKSLEEPWNALALSLALSLAKDKAQSDTWLKKACDGLKRRDADSRRAAEMLGGGPALTKEIHSIMLAPSLKALFLAAMADRFPKGRAEFAALARKLDVGGMPPHLLVRKVVQQAP